MDRAGRCVLCRVASIDKVSNTNLPLHTPHTTSTTQEKEQQQSRRRVLHHHLPSEINTKNNQANNIKASLVCLDVQVLLYYPPPQENKASLVYLDVQVLLR